MKGEAERGIEKGPEMYNKHSLNGKSPEGVWTQYGNINISTNYVFKITTGDGFGGLH